MKRWKVAGINFEHFHMGDNLRFAAEHSDVEIVGICDERRDRMQDVIDGLSIPLDRVFTDWRKCMEMTQPDLVLLCPSAAGHAIWTERVFEFEADILIEKPFAASLVDADRMIRAAANAGRTLAINWPMAWYPTNQTARRMISSGMIGEVIEVHYYDGNRGPLYHTAGKQERPAEEIAKDKPTSWFYSRSAGGGSLLDYLGYGSTLATWMMDGRKPIEVTAMVDQPAGLEVDEHSVVVARYETGLSKFETRWGTFTDPWTHQPQPKCGFVIVGSCGTISSYDFEPTITVQTRDTPNGRSIPVDELDPCDSNPIDYLIDRLDSGQPIEGPLSTAISRIGQQIVDTAIASAEHKKTLPLIDE